MNAAEPPTTQTSEFTTASEDRPRVSLWQFILPLLLQSALIVAIPAKDAYTYLTGTTVILQTAPVDPYDLIRGYSQTLSYEISIPDRLEDLPGGEWFKQDNTPGTVFVVLEVPATPQSAPTQPPQAWKPIRISPTQPTDLNPNQIALKGRFQGWQILYGLERYYMPEDQRQQINDDIQAIRQQGQQSFVVETKVSAQGDAVPVSLWIRDRNYRF